MKRRTKEKKYTDSNGNFITQEQAIELAMQQNNLQYNSFHQTALDLCKEALATDNEGDQWIKLRCVANAVKTAKTYRNRVQQGTEQGAKALANYEFKSKKYRKGKGRKGRSLARQGIVKPNS